MHSPPWAEPPTDPGMGAILAATGRQQHSPLRQTDRWTDSCESRHRRWCKTHWSGKYWGCLRKRGGSRKSWLPAAKVAMQVTVNRGQTHPRLTTGYSAEAARAGGEKDDLCPIHAGLQHPVGSGLAPAFLTPLTLGCRSGSMARKAPGSSQG